jgi:hypothetical protein
MLATSAADVATATAAAPAAAAPRRRKAPRRKKMPVVTAEIVSETPVAMPSLPPIPASYKYADEYEGRAYQPVRWMGTGKAKAAPKKAAKSSPVKPHMVKGSQAARDHMAKLRAMRMKKQGGALYPAGY